MLDQRLRRWPNIKQAVGQRLVFTGTESGAVVIQDNND